MKQVKNILLIKLRTLLFLTVDVKTNIRVDLKEVEAGSISKSRVAVSNRTTFRSRSPRSAVIDKICCFTLESVTFVSLPC